MLPADAVVVGAGVVGSSVALELARGGLGVVVVDKAGAPGHGSTSASAAIIRFGYSTAGSVAAAWESKHRWTRWRDHLEAPAGSTLARFHQVGFASLDNDVAPRERYIPLFDQVGVRYEEWDAETLRRRIPGLDAGRFGPPARLADEGFWRAARGELGALYTPDGGFVDDPQLAAQNLADAAQARGARFRFHRTVTAVEQAGDRVTGVRLDDGQVVSAPIVVNAAGPWSSRLNRLAGLDGASAVGTRPLRGEVAHVPAPPAYRGGAAPVVADSDLGTYLRPDPPAGLLVGGTEPACDPLNWVDDPDAVQPRPTQAVFEVQVTRAARRFPELGVPRIPAGVVGVYDVADDWTPIYDRTDLAGYYVAIGTSGNQFKNAPLIGTLLATIIDAVENGHDHDTSPVSCACEHTSHVIDLGGFSRNRVIDPAISNVLG